MSKTSLSELLSVTRTSINRWINCICAPDLVLFPRLCEVLNMYYNNMKFRHLINRYRSDETFRNELDKVLESLA